MKIFVTLFLALTLSRKSQGYGGEYRLKKCDLLCQHASKPTNPQSSVQAPAQNLDDCE
jgi:hypothetical protein